MRYCGNSACDYPDEPLERISDYKVTSLGDGTQVVLCVGCAEAQPCFDGTCDCCDDDVGMPDQYEAQAVLRGEG